MAPRATWKGSLSVSLFSLGVKAYASSSSEGSSPQLHQLHHSCRSRIRYQKVCPRHGPVAGDQIVMGYQHAPDRHAVVNLDELDRLRSEHQLRDIRIDAFLSAGNVGPCYLGERHYYLLPDGPAAQLPYALLIQAMLSRQVEAIAEVVLSKREQLVLLRIVEKKLLLMSVLKYAAQVRSPETFLDDLPASPSPAEEELALAEALVAKRTCPQLDLSRYRDLYAEKLRELIEAQLQGRELAPPPEHEPGQVLSLLESLRQSVAEGGKRAKRCYEKIAAVCCGSSSRGRRRPGILAGMV